MLGFFRPGVAGNGLRRRGRGQPGGRQHLIAFKRLARNHLFQVYILRGEERENIDNLIERFCTITIPKQLIPQFNLPRKSVACRLVEWPDHDCHTQMRHSNVACSRRSLKMSPSNVWPSPACQRPMLCHSNRCATTNPRNAEQMLATIAPAHFLSSTDPVTYSYTHPAAKRKTINNANIKVTKCTFRLYFDFSAASMRLASASAGGSKRCVEACFPALAIALRSNFPGSSAMAGRSQIPTISLTT